MRGRSLVKYLERTNTWHALAGSPRYSVTFSYLFYAAGWYSMSTRIQHTRRPIESAHICLCLQAIATDYMPSHAQVVEVGPRDGLQSERIGIPTDLKVRMVNLLSLSGLSRIEVTSFVSPKWVPQLADADEVMKTIDRHEGVQYSVLTPNMKVLANDSLCLCLRLSPDPDQHVLSHSFV